jgi:hypothetical protein
LNSRFVRSARTELAGSGDQAEHLREFKMIVWDCPGRGAWRLVAK